MKLTIFKRTGEKKSDNKRLRYAGEIPAVLYGAKHKNENVVVKTADFQAVIRNLKPGRLPTTLFELHYDNAVHKAVVREIQYHRTNYQVEHIDFGIVTPNLPVTVKVPIVCTGMAECAGIKLGGFLRQAVRYIKVSCLPNNIPSEIIVDVRNMQLLEAKKLADIELPPNVKPVARMEEVAIVIGKY